MALYIGGAGYFPCSLVLTAGTGKCSIGSIAIEVFAIGRIFAVAVSIIDDHRLYISRGFHPVTAGADLINFAVFDNSTLGEDDRLTVDIEGRCFILNLKLFQGYTSRCIRSDTPDVSATGIHTGNNELTVPVGLDGNMFPVGCAGNTGHLLHELRRNFHRVTEISIGCIVGEVLTSRQNLIFPDVTHKGLGIHQRDMVHRLRVVRGIGVCTSAGRFVVIKSDVGSNALQGSCIVHILEDTHFPKNCIEGS